MSEQLISHSLRLPKSASADLDRVAEAAGMTRSELLRVLVMEALESKLHVASPAVTENPSRELGEVAERLAVAVARLESWAPPAPPENEAVTQLSKQLVTALSNLREISGRRDEDSDRQGLRRVEAAIVELARGLEARSAPTPDSPPWFNSVSAQLHRLTELVTDVAGRKKSGPENELKLLRQQTAQMLAMLHQYRTNGTAEAAADFGKRIIQ